MLPQNYDNLEYIIIDCNSIDSAIVIINKYSNRIAKIISEKDELIYDAINHLLKKSIFCKIVIRS